MYVNLILWKDKYILGRIDLYFGEFREMLTLFKEFGGKEKILPGSCGICFQGFGEINAFFSGIKGAHTPWGPQY